VYVVGALSWFFFLSFSLLVLRLMNHETVINGENAAYKAPAFIARAKRTRETILKGIIEDKQFN